MSDETKNGRKKKYQRMSMRDVFMYQTLEYSVLEKLDQEVISF